VGLTTTDGTGLAEIDDPTASVLPGRVIPTTCDRLGDRVDDEIIAENLRRINGLLAAQFLRVVGLEI